MPRDFFREDVFFVSIDFSQLRDFVVAIAQTDLSELTIKTQDLELTLRKDKQPVISANVVESVGASPIVGQEKTTVPVAAPTETQPPSPIDKKWSAILSPMVGTFYRAPAPGESPFVELNDRVKSTQTVCIIEAMKLMNEIETELSGQIMEIAVENGQPVEYGQVLMWINPE